MNKQKYYLIYACIFIPLMVFMGWLLLRISKIQQAEEKIVLSREIQQAQRHLMVDLLSVPQKAIRVPADGKWYDEISVAGGQQAFDYVIKEDHLWRFSQGQSTMVAYHMEDLRIRHQSSSPDIFEIQIEAATNGVEMYSYLKIRAHQ